MESILTKEELLDKFVAHMKAEKRLSVDRATNFVNEVLLVSENIGLTSKEDCQEGFVEGQEHGRGACEPPELRRREVTASALGEDPEAHPHHISQVPPRAGWGRDRVLGGKAKLELRRRINDEKPKQLKDNVSKAISTKNVLTKARSRPFARRSRDYRRAYTAMGPENDVERLSEEHGGAEGFHLVETMRKRRKVHLNIVHMEASFLSAN